MNRNEECYVMCKQLLIFLDALLVVDRKRTLYMYPCDEAWEFINLTLLCVACLLSERKGSMWSEVMIDDATKDACRECLRQSPGYAT